MATLIPYRVDLDGGKPTFSAASSGGDNFVNLGRMILVVKNGGTSSTTVTVNSRRLCDFGYDHDAKMDVAAGEEGWLGPFSSRFNDTDGKVEITYTAVTSVTVAVVEVPAYA